MTTEKPELSDWARESIEQLTVVAVAKVLNAASEAVEQIIKDAQKKISEEVLNSEAEIALSQ